MKLKFLIHNLSKIWGTIFWQRVHRWQKWNQFWKAPPGGQAEIKNEDRWPSGLKRLFIRTVWGLRTRVQIPLRPGGDLVYQAGGLVAIQMWGPSCLGLQVTKGVKLKKIPAHFRYPNTTTLWHPFNLVQAVVVVQWRIGGTHPSLSGVGTTSHRSSRHTLGSGTPLRAVGAI